MARSHYIVSVFLFKSGKVDCGQDGKVRCGEITLKYKLNEAKGGERKGSDLWKNGKGTYL
jgi:hypothetical protein